MKILITGGSGFIGTNLIDFYAKKGYALLNIDIVKPRNIDHFQYWQECDIRDYDLFLRLVNDFKPRIVIHLAAKADLIGKSLEDYSTNTKGVEVLIEVCNQIDTIELVVFTSTMLVCSVGYKPSNEDDYLPPNLYGVSKMIGEQIVKDKKNLIGFKWFIIRPTSIWGPWFGPTYRRFFEMIMKKRYILFSGHSSTKTYGYIGNSVYQIDALIRNQKSLYKTFYIGDYEPTNINEWACEVSNLVGYKPITLPNIIVYFSGVIGDIFKVIGLKFPMNTFRYKNMTTNNVVDLENTKSIAPNLPFTRDYGNRTTLNWMKDVFFKL